MAGGLVGRRAQPAGGWTRFGPGSGQRPTALLTARRGRVWSATGEWSPAPRAELWAPLLRATGCSLGRGRRSSRRRRRRAVSGAPCQRGRRAATRHRRVRDRPGRCRGAMLRWGAGRAPSLAGSGRGWPSRVVLEQPSRGRGDGDATLRALSFAASLLRRRAPTTDLPQAIGTRRGTGTLHAADGHAEVAIRFSIVDGDAGRPWRGFLGPADAGTAQDWIPEEGDLATLATAAGTTGDVLITRHHHGRVPALLSFVGVGPAPGRHDPDDDGERDDPAGAGRGPSAP